MSTVAASNADRSHVHGFFASRDGLQLYYEISAGNEPVRGTLLFVHGYGDHCRRYVWPIEHLMARGFHCVAFDYRGHGQAAGQRGHCYHFEEYLGDLEAALELARKQAAGQPLFVIGHSHGGLVALRYFLERAHGGVAGLVLSSPFFGLAMAVPAIKVAAGRLLSRLMPRLTMKSDIPAEHLSHEASVAKAYETDRWVHKVATARWFTECSAAQAYCLAQAGRLALPFLVLAAGDDRIASLEATRAVFDAVPNRDKQLIVYPGYFHEIFNETGRAQVFTDLGTWLARHL